MDRDAAERELTRLINRALRSVPFVKLDKVDEVTYLFEQAVERMESSSDLSSEERDRLARERKNEWGTGDIRRSPARDNRQIRQAASSDSEESERGESHLGAKSTSTAGKLDVDEKTQSGQSASGSEGRFVPKPLTHKVVGSQVTRDYSSPKGQSRGLKKQPGVSSRAGITASTSSGSDTEAKLNATAVVSEGGRIGLGSSRVPAGPLRHAVIARAAGLPLERGSSASASGSSVAVQSRLDDDSSVQLSPKFTQDYSSPKRKVRSLDGGSKAGEKGKAKSSRATVSNQRTSHGDQFEDREGQEEEYMEELTIPRESKVFDKNASAEGAYDTKDSGSEGDDELNVRKRPARSTEEFDTSKLVGGSSPKALKASKRLLLLASPHPETLSLAMRNQGQAHLETKEKENEMPLAQSPQPGTGTPKPAFLRRLDSPQSHHGKLLVAKTKLTNMLTHSLRMLPKLRMDSFEEVKKALLKAVNKLESGTVSP